MYDSHYVMRYNPIIHKVPERRVKTLMAQQRVPILLIDNPQPPIWPFSSLTRHWTVLELLHETP